MAHEEHERGTAAAETDDLSLLLSLVEALIPARDAHGAMPAASDLPEFRGLSSQEAALLYGPALEWLRGRDRVTGPPGFASLDRQARQAILRELEEEAPDVVNNAFVQTAMRYYASDAVARALGLEARPPHPRGYGLDETNWALLDPVRAMEPLYKTIPGQGEKT